MREQINLASEPFRRDRSVFVASVAISAALLALLGILIAIALADRRNMAESQAELARLNIELTKVAREQKTLDAELHQPGNSDVLERSEFINTLLYRKGISWTKIFADLEKTVPNNVRIISIQPQVNAQDQIFLQMVVGADAPEHAINFFAKLEASEFFGSTAVSSVIPPSQTDPLYRYRLSVNYAQRF